MSPRMSAADRRELTVRAAIVEFARGGYEGTSTAAIAERVGVSQPYLFRLFPSKRAIFLAAATRCFDEIEGEIRDAAGGLHGSEAMTAMGLRYQKLLRGDTTLLQFQLHIYAVALDDEDVRRLGHGRWARLWRTVGELSGEDHAEVMRFAAVGMLLNVLTVFGVPYAPGPGLAESLDAWARRTCAAEDPDGTEEGGG